MSETKIEFRAFNVAQWQEEEDYLREMHNLGWRFVQVNLLGIYHFERCQPEDVIYQLDYNQEGLAEKSQYIKMFVDCGWEYLQDYVGYSYFRKPTAEMNGEERIFCDDQSRLEMMRRVFRGRVIPLILLFLCSVVPNLLRYLLDDGLSLGPWIGVTLMLVFAIYAVMFAKFAYYYWKFREGCKK